MSEYLSASERRRLSLLKEQKYPTDGPKKSYVDARERIRAFAIQRQPLSIAGMRDHEAEIIQCLVDNEWAPPAPQSSRPPTRDRELLVEGVEIKAYPDLLCSDPQSGRDGAIKFYFGKSAPLDPSVAQHMATVLYYFEREIMTNQRVHPSLCAVYDVRQDVEYIASKSTKRLMGNIEAACTFIKAVWPGL
ncbi:MAG: hypothetical protein IPK74_10095 [Deltaproteobacteria bacterium]|nr:hypothetical protein [Deltaproteobacteria bacterium]